MNELMPSDRHASSWHTRETITRHLEDIILIAAILGALPPGETITGERLTGWIEEITTAAEAIAEALEGSSPESDCTTAC